MLSPVMSCEISEHGGKDSERKLSRTLDTAKLLQWRTGRWEKDRREESSCEVRDFRQLYREELELERERWRLRPGERERVLRRTGERLRGDRDLLLRRGGVRRHIGGGGGILRRGEGLRGGGRIILGASTAVAVISCPSI